MDELDFWWFYEKLVVRMWFLDMAVEAKNGWRSHTDGVFGAECEF